MGILLLYKRHPIFDFIDSEKLGTNLEIIREYFESDEVINTKKLFEDCEKRWEDYLDELLKIRRLKLFNSEIPIPDEKIKIDEYATANNLLAIEIKKLYDFKDKIIRTWPISEIESEKERYAEWKKISRMEEEAFPYLLHNALKIIYYPKIFFEECIFKLEEEYKNFKYDYMDFIMGPEGLYISYLIHKKEGPDEVFDNLQDFIISRYIPKPTIGIDLIRLITLFMHDGNDANNCNRFFTRRMKDNISRELDEYIYLINSINTEGYNENFKHLFLSNPYSIINTKDPFDSISGREPGLIEQAFYNHLIGNYSAAANLLFPIIEGIIWDISAAEHLRNQNIYTQDSDLTNRIVRNRTLLHTDGSPMVKRHGYPTLRELLELTKMSNIINLDFFIMLIQEMYPSERNPILHGLKLDYNDPWQSARLLLMLEYLHHLIRKKNYLYPVQLDEPEYWTPEKNKE